MAFMGLELSAKEEDAKRAKNEGYAQNTEASRTGHITINDWSNSKKTLWLKRDYWL